MTALPTFESITPSLFSRAAPFVAWGLLVPLMLLHALHALLLTEDSARLGALGLALGYLVTCWTYYRGSLGYMAWSMLALGAISVAQLLHPALTAQLGADAFGIAAGFALSSVWLSADH